MAKTQKKQNGGINIPSVVPQDAKMKSEPTTVAQKKAKPAASNPSKSADTQIPAAANSNSLIDSNALEVSVVRSIVVSISRLS